MLTIEFWKPLIVSEAQTSGSPKATFSESIKFSFLPS
jgi:hypothetical protein